MKVKLIMAITADGCIAKGVDHTPMDWTSTEDKKHFREATQAAGVLIMGLNTYETIGRALPNRLNVILTYDEREYHPGVLEHKSGDVKIILKELEDRGYKEVIIAGGTFVNSLFLKEGLLDEIQLTIEPTVFGSGMREDYCLQRSDLDLLVEIDPLETSSYFDDHFNLSEG